MLMMTVAGVYQVTSQTEDQDQYLDELEHLSGGNLPCTVPTVLSMIVIC